MSRFAQYYIRFRHDAGCYDWEKRQQHLGALFERDESIEFFLGEGEEVDLWGGEEDRLWMEEEEVLLEQGEIHQEVGEINLIAAKTEMLNNIY